MSRRPTRIAATVPAAAAVPLPGAPLAADPLAGSTPLAAIEPAIDAAAARAAAERVADPAAEGIVPAVPAAPPIADAGLPATVLPDPALPAPPEAPQPLVTAAPPIAAEPSVVDVVEAAKAEAGQLLDRAGLNLGAVPADREGPHFAQAGQPVIAIEPARPGAATIAAEAATTPLPEASDPYLPVVVIEVVGPERGRYRAGFAFGATPRRFLETQLTTAQLAAIEADPQLAVGFREIDAVDAALLEG